MNEFTSEPKRCPGCRAERRHTFTIAGTTFTWNTVYDCKSMVFSDERIEYSHECLQKQVELMRENIALNMGTLDGELRTVAKLEQENDKLKNQVAILEGLLKQANCWISVYNKNCVGNVQDMALQFDELMKQV